MINNCLTINQMDQLAELSFSYDCANIPNYLYHYTSQENANLILSQKGVNLRLTDIEHFEDKTEGRLIEEYYKTALDELKSEKIINSHHYDILKSILIRDERIIVHKDMTASLSKCRAFVSCFSKIPDSLYMYNNYVKCENNKGYCLGVPKWMFQDKSDFKGMPLEFRYSLSPVLYGKESIERIKLFLTIAKKICIDFDDTILIEKIIPITTDILYGMKHITKLEKYRKENEVRLIVYIPLDNDNTLKVPSFIDYCSADPKHIYICYDKVLEELYSHNISKEDEDSFKSELNSRGYIAIQ